jgi:hypothetical protein
VSLVFRITSDESMNPALRGIGIRESLKRRSSELQLWRWAVLKVNVNLNSSTGGVRVWRLLVNYRERILVP